MAETVAPSSMLPSLPGIQFLSSFLTLNNNTQEPTTANPSDHIDTVASSANSPDLASSDRQTPSTATISNHAHTGSRNPPLRRRNTSDLEPVPENRGVMLPTLDTPESSSVMSLSREGSFLSEAKKRKRNSRPKTTFSICHPPPKVGPRTKISVRARPLLQFQQIVAGGRPKPAFELLPSAIFSPKLAKAVTKVFGNRHSMNSADLALVKAEEYHQHDESSVDVDESRDVLALICGVGKRDSNTTGKTRILFADGSDWEITQLSSGNYECNTVDIHGLKTTVRWVQKKSANARNSYSTPEFESTPEKKFNFSTISPNTRRHPIIAGLTSGNLEISDIYNIPAPASLAFTPEAAQDAPTSPGELVTTTAVLRNVITATAAFVAVREGWSQSHRSEDSLQRSSSNRSVASSKFYATPPASPRKADGDFVRRNGSFLRSPSFLGRQSSTARPSSPLQSIANLDGGVKDAPVLEAAPASRRGRANTTSTVIFNDNAGQWRPEVGGDAPEEGDDEEEDDDEGDEDEEEVDARVEKQIETGHNQVKNSSRTSQSSTRKVSDSSSGSEDQSWNEKKKRSNKTAKTAKPVAEPKKKSKFLRILTCGMI